MVLLLTKKFEIKESEENKRKEAKKLKETKEN